METQLKQWYSHQGMAHALSIYNFPEDYGHRSHLRTLALRYIFTHRRAAGGYVCPGVQELTQTAIRMFDEFLVVRNREALYELADIVGTFAPNNRHVLLDRLRNLENPGEIRNALMPHPDQEKPAQKTVYADSQNVHNSKINKTVITAAETLCGMFNDIINLKDVSKAENGKYKDDCLEEIRVSLVRKYPEKEELINESVKYIKTNTGLFGGTDTRDGISMEDTFLAIYLWIKPHKDAPELEKRLLEELKEMHGYCTTGHMARLLSIIQGFTDDERLCIKISDSEQCNAVVRQFLTKALEECKDDKVAEGMLEGNEYYAKFIRTKISEKLLEWEKEYGQEMLDQIASIVNSFAGIIIFSE